MEQEGFIALKFELWVPWSLDLEQQNHAYALRMDVRGMYFDEKLLEKINPVLPTEPHLWLKASHINWEAYGTEIR